MDKAKVKEEKLCQLQGRFDEMNRGKEKIEKENKSLKLQIIQKTKNMIANYQEIKVRKYQ